MIQNSTILIHLSENYTAANNLALQAMKLFQKAIEILESLLG